MDVYEDFCEVVTFNIKYLINKYDMTFNTFVGVNNRSCCVYCRMRIVKLILGVQNIVKIYAWMCSKYHKSNHA
jgi:hypothetical protein